MAGQRKFPCVESMTRLSLSRGVSVRVWREEDEVKPRYDNDDLALAARQVDATHPGRLDMIAEALAQLPRVNAVEALNCFFGQGVVVYTSWP